MTLFNIAKRNIIQNSWNYFIYFISQIFSIMVFYIFCTLFLNPEFYRLSETSSKLSGGFRSTAVIVIIFSSIFIWYSNNFFIKTRKKEIGLYGLLGVSKRQIGRMLFFENMIIGLLSLLCGIFFGTLFSKLFSMMLMSFMASVINIQFMIVPNAIYVTIIAFLIIFLISSLQSYRIIYRFNLIDLFVSHKEGEKVPKFSSVIAYGSIILLVACYIVVLFIPNVSIGIAMLPITVLVSLCTYGIFHNFILLILRKLKNNKEFYYKKDNLITTSQLFYRIKSNATVLATISIITAAILITVGGAYSLYKSSQLAPYKNNAYSFMYIGGDGKIDEKVLDAINEFPDNKVTYQNEISAIPVELDLEKYYSKSYFIYTEQEHYLISEKTYNQVLKHRGSRHFVELNNSNECIYIIEPSLMSIDNYFKDPKIEIKISGYSQSFTPDLSKSRILDFPLILKKTVIVKDDVFNKYYNALLSSGDSGTVTLKGISVENYKSSRELTKKLSEIIPPEREMASFFREYEQGMMLFGQIIFIGLFLGMLFIMATGSIIYFKQLNDASENRYRFEILKKIGLSDNETGRIILKNLLVIFATPFVLGLSHSLFALNAFSKMMQFPIKNYVIFVIFIYFVIYVFYFFITFNSYSKIVSKREIAG